MTAPRKTCENGQCGRVSQKHGYCYPCYAEVTGNPAPPHRRRLCPVEECGRLSQGSRYEFMCARHYREKTGRAPEKPGVKRTLGKCIGPECDRDAVSKDLCTAHESQMRSRGRLWVIGSRPGRAALRECLAPACGQPTVRWGYCETHAVEHLGACWIPWCEDPVQHKRLGLCETHARQNRYMTHHYGIGMSERYKLADRQGGACTACGEPDERGSLHVDHCHATNKVRGLLCGNCNRAIGLFKDNPASLRKAADYLEAINAIP